MITVIYEDENIIAVNKPAGLIVHPTETSKEKTLVTWLLENYPEIKNVGDDPTRPGIVHRLDKDTSGVLVVAKNQKTFEYLKQQFKDRKIKKTYIALVKGNLEKTNGKIETPIKRFSKIRDAVTEYKVIKKFEGYTLLEVYPKTGRTHQIRVHLKAIGHPIVCDKLYTKHLDCPFGLNRQFLHAQALELTLPSDGRIKIEADLPDDLRMELKSLEECDKKEKC